MGKTKMTRFLFETYKQHHDEGIVAHKAGDYPKARLHYLMAAKYLCALAKEAGAEFKQERLKRAQRLIEIAKELEGKEASRARGGSQAKDGWDAARRVPKVPTEDEDEEPQGDRWIVSDPPKTSFEDVAGLEDVKRVINLRVIYPLRHPEATSRFRKRAGGGVLLYGPPGTVRR
jgi:SpoVK/Ycf46/Vps4 family AAA+-type ATPase